MKFTKIALAVGLSCILGSAVAAGNMQYKPGLGVQFASLGTVGLGYFFGADNSNRVGLEVGYFDNDHKTVGSGAKTSNTADNVAIPVFISYNHYFALGNSNKLFWGLGAGYTRTFGSRKDSAGVSQDDESWGAGAIVSLQYRLTSQFYLNGGFTPYGYYVDKYQNSTDEVTRTEVGDPFVSVEYQF